VTGLAPAPAAGPARRATPTYVPGAPGVAFGLFLVLTAVLLVRPTEIIPSLAGVPVFQAVILACLAVTFPRVLAQLTPAALQDRPITACVLGVAMVVPLSHLSHGADEQAADVGGEFLKVVAYYLLLMAVVDTPRRLRALMAWLLGCLAVHTALALLHFHGFVDIPAMNAVTDVYANKETGEVASVSRMCGVGLFGNPNDLARILAIGIALTLYLAGEVPRVLVPGLLGLAGMFGYALTQTHSRGGLLALAVTLLTLLYVRFGGKRTAVLGLLALPVGMAVFGGRQTDISTDEGTGQQRIQLWLEGFDSLRETPVLGIGAEKFSELTGGLGAHNAYVECYVELGLFGGTCFLAAVGLAVWQTYRLGAGRAPGLPRLLARIYPFVLAVVAGYAVGMLSSSRSYGMPTYLVLGLAAAYQRLAGAAAPRLAPRLDGRMAVRLLVGCGLVMAVLYVFARAMVHWQ
jgi:O-antigen ligase